MPIVNLVIKNQVAALLTATQGLELAQAQDQFAKGIADIIESALKSAIVTIPPGSIVTTGSAATQTNPGPAQGTLH